jgi:RIO kinase 2
MTRQTSPGIFLTPIYLQHATSTSASGENKSINLTADSTVDATESGGDEDAEDEDDALLTKQLNKQRKRAMAAALGRRRPLTSRNTYKDKGKGTMNSKIQKQSCQW